MATQTKAKAAASKNTEIEEQIEVFEPVKKAVDRVLTHPDTNEKKTFVQHEMGFMTKLKFFRLLSGTLRLASESDAQANGSGGVAVFLQETVGNIQNMEDANATNEFLVTMMRLIELVPEFAEELYLLALNVRPSDQVWATEALGEIDDDLGEDILVTFIAQNGKSITDFFGKRLRRIGKRINHEINLKEALENTTS